MTKFALVGLLTLASSALMLAQPKPKSQAEITALQAMFGALNNPDACIKAGEDVLANFANTEFKSIVLSTVADAYNRKGDSAKSIAYGEQALAADPKNYQAMLLLAQTISSHVGTDDLDRDKRLAEADKYASQAIATIKDATKMNAAMPDDQWAAQKKDLTADAHQAMGISAVVRKKYDVAIAEFKIAIDEAANPDPATMVRLGQTYNKAGQYDEAIAVLEKAMASPIAQPSIKQFAQAEKVRAVTAKAAKK
jgi:tetratricopeptide (TPR) repeat protein